jgi:phosphoglycolate phosphatase-like HAD superfamily hydrolase
MSRRIVIFDFDGTLADTMDELVEAMVETFGEHLGSDGRRRRERVMELLDLPPPQMNRAMIDVTGLPPSQLRSMFAPVVARLPTRLFPEVPAVLASLKESGYVVVISSHNPDDTFSDRLAGVGLTGQYDFALGTNVEKGVTKEDHPRVAAERLRLPHEEFAASGVFVGDLPSDMRLARKSDLLAIGRLTRGNADRLIGAGAQHVIADLTELEPLLSIVNAATPRDSPTGHRSEGTASEDAGDSGRTYSGR